MTAGKLFAGAIVISAAIAGAALYYLQVYAYYDEVAADAPEAQIMLTSLASKQPETFLFEDFQGIDATSSPLRFRACFTTPQSQAMLTETYVTMEDAVPLMGPNWFDCYDAREIGAALETGDAIAFLGQKDILDGIDRVIAVFPDGRGFAWHQLNDKYKE
ncbi:MAG: histidine kinase [Marinosulfonomonas sp.]|nr:histidine kinase [Marinosulfonomonas sp.]